ncbi:uncharacterized protein TA03200 [Theileria annulata]|uniref:Uncharacterized protein n=1 Tax=Theileria annulata TaxID=5874 RepID=Q4UCZ2_THEAN|nr:uncharacterized protein TA03200 [Theileria annulata]CAI75309.1 hypothetical protein, conserved [Theileria annulata]|eukprot:XP_954785.1 hypothetical protein, conserved [Theileria annulata]
MCISFNVPPPGSRIEFELNRIKIDPLNNSPWEYEVAIFESIGKDRNVSYNFLRNEWGYLDHTLDPYQPSGVIEGGPENYEGKGLELKVGKDRQRTEILPYYLDHGVYYRQRDKGGTVSYDISPIACQDISFCIQPYSYTYYWLTYFHNIIVLDETDLDLERKQWGSWHQPKTNTLGYLRSAFRSFIRMENTTELPYPWIKRFDIFEKVPLHRERPSTTIPFPDPDWRLSALDCFAGVYPHHNLPTVEECLVRQKKLLKEWSRLEKLYNKSPDKQLLQEIKEIKFALFGVPDFSDSEDEMLKVVSNIALSRARTMLQLQAYHYYTIINYNDWRKDPETIEYYITRTVEGEVDPSSDYHGPEKTVVLNLVNYRPMSKKFRVHRSIEEMAEAYHRVVTENRREGRAHTRTQMTPNEEHSFYPLRKQRRKFPALEAEYRPIWTNRSYGSEFGDALRKSQKIPEKDLTEFGKALRKRKRKFTKDVSLTLTLINHRNGGPISETTTPLLNMNIITDIQT